MEDDLNAVDTDVANWEQKRIDLQRDVPDELLVRYERIKKRNKGVGVTSVWKAVCNGCHMNIPPQLYNELQRSDDLLSCPNCNRIMYFQDMEKPVQILWWEKIINYSAMALVAAIPELVEPALS